VEAAQQHEVPDLASRVIENRGQRIHSNRYRTYPQPCLTRNHALLATMTYWQP
jgi:hypothetical protein